MKEQHGEDLSAEFDFSFFLPHAMFSHYYHHNMSRFDQLFLGKCRSRSDRIGRKLCAERTLA
eukprot:3045768-Pyramimonas_sp.AAC.1